MKLSTSLAVAAGLATRAAAKDIPIAVGQQQLKFTPNSVTAAVGDELVFTFYPANHSVSTGDFKSGCTPSTSGGFYSGFVPTPAGSQQVSRARPPPRPRRRQLTAPESKAFRVKVTSTDPIVFYCTQPNNNHCKAGMYGVVNPSGEQSLQAYGTLAKAATANVSPQQGTFGGTLGSVGDSGSSSGSNTASAPGGTPTGTGYGGGNGGGYGGGGYGGDGSGSGTQTTAGGAGSTTTTRPNAASSAKSGLAAVFGAVAFALFMA